jgi:hypothetical protein
VAQAPFNNLAIHIVRSLGRTLRIFAGGIRFGGGAAGADGIGRDNDK